MAITKSQNNQIVNEAALPVMGQAARTQDDTLMAAIDQNFGAPLRMYATFPTADAHLNFSAQEIQRSNGTGISVSPLSNNIPTVIASTVNFQTGATTGATFSLTLPTSTLNYYRRCGFSLLSNGTIQAVFSAEASTLAACANAGTLFIKGAQPIGWVDLQCTNASGQYKTADSATSIIENSVSGTSTIHGFGSGSGGGSGTGDASELLERLKEELSVGDFGYMTANIFAQDAQTLIDNSSTGTFDQVNQAYSLPTIGNTFVSAAMLDSEWHTRGEDIAVAKLTVYHKLASYDAAMTYQLSRDGGTTYQNVTMSRVGSTDTAQGQLTFAATETPSLLEGSVTTNGSQALNTSSVQRISAPFTITSAQYLTSLEATLIKTGSPAGSFTYQIVKDSSGNPSTVSTDVMAVSSAVLLSSVAAGPAVVNAAVNGVVIPPGTYHLVLVPDSVYQASFSSGVTELKVSTNTTGTTLARVFNGTTWSAGSVYMTYGVRGRALDLRVKLISGTASAVIMGYGVFYSQQTGSIPGILETETQSFSGTTNPTQFTISRFLPNPKTLKVYSVEDGRVFVYPAFDVSGQYVTFAANTFNYPGQTVTLVFDQTQGAAIDTRDANSTAIATHDAQLTAIGEQFDDYKKVQLPQINAPYTTISNRGKMSDLANDLGVCFGVNRHTTQNLYPIKGESGPNGEMVYGITDDYHNQVRFVGSVSTLIGDSGEFIISGAVGDFVEITFYGTGLNLLMYASASGTRDIRASVDGGAEGSNLYPGGASLSGILLSRNDAINYQVQVASGLSLGIHTVKIRAAVGTDSLSMYGFEAVIDASTVKIQPGSYYVNGKKLALSTAQAIAYNSSFESGTLGTAGGRVVTYLKSDGTIAKALTPTNTSAAYLTSADHTNEDVVRAFNWREFGGGRSSDFSTANTTGAARADVLPDNSFSLTCQNGSMNATGSIDAFRFGGTATDFITINFIGTGLDIHRRDDATGTDTYEVFVDGTSVGNLNSTGSTADRVEKIASGLPYGSHTVKIVRNTTASFRVLITNFIVYQPKKPSIPSGAVELGEYNLVANYTVATAGSPKVARGVIRKQNVSEFIYVGSWTGSTLDALYPSGLQVDTVTSAGQTVTGYFFGTGFEWRTFGGFTQNTTISVDGSTNLSSFTTSSYGTGTTFTAATGVVTTNATGTYGSGVSVSGLALGWHKIIITANTGRCVHENLDVITPVHAYKQNLFVDYQTNLPIGACAIGDLRAINNKLTKPKAMTRAVVPPGVGISTSSTTMVPISYLSSVITLTDNGFIEAWWQGILSPSVTNTAISIGIAINGVIQDQWVVSYENNGGYHTRNLCVTAPGNKGANFVQVFWSVASGSVSTSTWSPSTVSSLRVREI